jgi:hypothetical protein
MVINTYLVKYNFLKYRFTNINKWLAIAVCD